MTKPATAHPSHQRRSTDRSRITKLPRLSKAPACGSSGARFSVAFKHFAEQLLHAVPRRNQGLAARRRRAVDAAVASAVQYLLRSQVAVPFHAVENRIERAGAEPVAVARELIDHCLAVDGAFGGVMEDVQTYQACIKISIMHRISMSESDSGDRSLWKVVEEC